MFPASRPTVVRAVLVTVATLSTAACDVPTSAPIIEQKWSLPVAGATLAVDRFLPSGVTIVGNAFSIALPSATISQSLGEMCPSCPPGRFTVPKPAFQARLDASVALPAGVAGAAISGGTVLLEVDNGFGFDPLRPSQSGPRGRLISTITSGSVVLAADTVTGAAASMAPGTTMARVIRITPASIGGPLQVSVVLDSPAGDPATVDASQRITVRATPKDWRIASARVTLANKDVRADDIAVDLGGVDGSLVDRVTGGALVLSVTNPLTASGTFTVEITAPGIAPITKPLTLAANATTTRRLEFTAAELRSILGKDGVRLALRGRASGTDAGTTVVVTPTNQITIASTLELTLRSEDR